MKFLSEIKTGELSFYKLLNTWEAMTFKMFTKLTMKGYKNNHSNAVIYELQAKASLRTIYDCNMITLNEMEKIEKHFDYIVNIAKK